MSWFRTEINDRFFLVFQDKDLFIEQVKGGEYVALMKMADCLRDEILSRKPATHMMFDIEIARIKNYAGLLSSYTLPVIHRGNLKYMTPFTYEVDMLEHYVWIMEKFRDSIRRIRRKVRNLVVRWVCNILFKLATSAIAYEIEPFMKEYVYVDSFNTATLWTKNSVKTMKIEEAIEMLKGDENEESRKAD